MGVHEENVLAGEARRLRPRHHDVTLAIKPMVGADVFALASIPHDAFPSPEFLEAVPIELRENEKRG